MPAVVETAVLTLPSPIPASLTSVKSLSLPSPSSPIAASPSSSSSSSSPSIAAATSSTSSPSSAQMVPSIIQPPSTLEKFQESPSKSPPKGDEFLQLLYLPHDEEELFQTWRLWTKTKGVLTNGNRLENASWRRWFQKKHNIRPLPSEILAPSLPALFLPSQEKEISNSKARVSQIFQQDLHLAKSLSADDVSSQPAPTRPLAPLPKRPKKKKKSVTFDLSKNRTAFVSYVEEQWETIQQPEMLLNVDELSRVKHAKLNLSHLLTSDPDLHQVIRAKESLMYPAGFDPLKYAEASPSSSSPSSSLQKKELPVEVISNDDSNPLAFLKELDEEDGMVASVIEFLFEVILFLKWCAALFFISPSPSPSPSSSQS